MTDNETIHGRIIRIIDDHTVVLNVGSAAGAAHNMRFAIVTPAEVIVDPETEEELGRYARRKGVVVVEELYDRFSIASAPAIKEKVVVESGGLLGFGMGEKRTRTTTRHDLDVEHDSIRQMPTGDTVKVGDLVVAARPKV